MEQSAYPIPEQKRVLDRCACTLITAFYSVNVVSQYSVLILFIYFEFVFRLHIVTHSDLCSLKIPWTIINPIKYVRFVATKHQV